MKTAMQELIDELESIKGYKYGGLVIRLIKDKLEKEKEQIMQSYNDGYVNKAFDKPRNPLEYYNQIFNQNK